MDDERLQTELGVALPGWVAAHLRRHRPGDRPDSGRDPHDPDESMGFVLDLAARNVAERTGGPFAAAVFAVGSPGTGRSDAPQLVSVGLNVVVPEHTSVAHAEVMALALAQQRLGTHDLSGHPAGPFELVSSSEMCAMCLGATVWSGVAAVTWSSSTTDVESVVGFDEGPRPIDPVGELHARRIAVRSGVLRERGRAVLEAYVAAGGEVYNAGGGEVQGSPGGSGT